MSKRAGIAVLAVLLCAPAWADFGSLVHAVSSHRGMHRVWTPGIGFARLVVWMIHPGGVSDFELAVFEGKEKFDSGDFARVIATSDRTPMVRVHSNRTGEVAVIWARPLEGEKMELLVLAHDPNDQTVVVRTVVNAEIFAREVANPRHASDIARR